MNLGKCYLGRTQVKYLGYLVGQGKVQAQLDKVKALKQAVRSYDKKGLQRFFGLDSFIDGSSLNLPVMPAEQKYSTMEKEVLAVNWATETLQYYLWGVPFTVITDHAPLAWLQQIKVTDLRLT